MLNAQHGPGRVSTELYTRRERLVRLPLHIHPTGNGRIAARGSCSARSRLAPRTAQVWRAVPLLHTVARLPFRHPPGRRVEPPTVSRHKLSIVQVCPSLLPSLTAELPRRGIGPPTVSLHELWTLQVY